MKRADLERYSPPDDAAAGAGGMRAAAGIRFPPSCWCWCFFLLHLRRPSLAQWVSLAGVLLFLYSGVRNMLYFSDILLPPVLSVNLTLMAMLLFMFCQMTAMFIGTIHTAEEAQGRTVRTGMAGSRVSGRRARR